MFSATFYLLDYRLLLWRRSGKEVDGDRIWKNLRLFSGWMCAGCVAGVATFSANMMWRNYVYEFTISGITRRHYYELLAMSYRYLAASSIFYPVHLLGVIFALSTLLRRVSDHASHSYYNTARDNDVKRSASGKKFDFRDFFGEYALYYWARSMHVIAIVLCSLNIVVGFVSAGLSAESAGLAAQAAAATADGRDTRASLGIFFNQQQASDRRFRISLGVGQVIETAVLVFVCTCFLFFFPATLEMFNRIERKMDVLLQEMHLRTDQGTAFLPFEFSPQAADGAETQTEMPIADVRRYLGDIKASAAAQWRRFRMCMFLIRTGLILLASHSIFVAIFAFGAEWNLNCGLCDPICQTGKRLMLLWYTYAPELFPLLSSLSTTLPLMFALWLMTTPEDRLLLLHPERHRFEGIDLKTVETERDARLRAERIRMGINLL